MKKIKTNLFWIKIAEVRKGNKFEDEIREEKEEKRKQEEEKKERQQAFKERANLFRGAD